MLHHLGVMLVKVVDSQHMPHKTIVVEYYRMSPANLLALQPGIPLRPREKSARVK